MPSGPRPQRRNRYAITVRFPETYSQVPQLAGTTQVMRYPTLDAADLAMRGFEMQGCMVTWGDEGAGA